ncbi:Os02g0311600 [Oryza sativa Japonica Group]|uniref:Os02g0311600 protein n=1 Tax=Oryza sativa subsp. japonica TaxID=39947 RepID=A0A0P0VI26_ORYSJ|nr:hypothetical protein EE612_010738 [Oryza sativa]BAS78317.1 Os02g0311600 [Oryza sativa Japonica Group]
MAGLDLNQPFNWDEVEDLEGEILDLNYDYVCYLENEDEEGGHEDVDNTAARGDNDDGGGGGDNDDGSRGGNNDDGSDDGGGSGGGDGDNDDGGGGGGGAHAGTGINIKRRRHYPPDVKRTIYAKLLEKSNPGMMKEGVTKSVANEMGVPLRVVQRVWRHRQIGDGIEAFESKKKKYCGTKNFRLILVSSKMCRLDNAIASVTWPTLCIWQKPHCLGV